MSHISGYMQELIKPKAARTLRISSTDPRGKNRDYWRIPPGESIVLADIDGPGCITHLWMTSFCKEILGPSTIPAAMETVASPSIDAMPVLGVNWEAPDPDYYRKVLLKMTWENQKKPSVLVPLGDFFGICNSIPASYEAFPFNVSVNEDSKNVYGAPASMNCYFAMPFQENARIEIINENDLPMVLFFMIDFEVYRTKFDEILYFHASWKRNNPCLGWNSQLAVNGPEIHSIANTDGKNNYVLLETRGRGHFVGFNLAVIHYAGNWWGEGNDMIFIDGEEEPSIVGTGGEDVFNLAWGFAHNQFLSNGNISGSTPANIDDLLDQQVAYRFYIMDPIRFDKSIKVTMEHGHANHHRDDWATTVYWYQDQPSQEITIQPLPERLPNKLMPSTMPKVKTKERTPAQQEAVDRFTERKEIYLKEKRAELQKAMEDTRKASGIQIEKARYLARKYKEGFDA